SPVSAPPQGSSRNCRRTSGQGRAGGNTEGDPPQRRFGGKGEKLMRFTVIYEKGPDSWGAYVPDLPGVISVGDSREEVEHLIQQAIEFHLEGMREEGIAIPAPSTFVGVIE